MILKAKRRIMLDKYKRLRTDIAMTYILYKTLEGGR